MTEMKKIPRNARTKRTQFFGDQAIDPMVTMATEMMAELWVVKERVFVLEKVLDNSGLNVQQQLEDFEISQEDANKLEVSRRQFVETIMRAFDAEHVDRDTQHSRIDEITESMKNADSSLQDNPPARASQDK